MPTTKLSCLSLVLLLGTSQACYSEEKSPTDSSYTMVQRRAIALATAESLNQGDISAAQKTLGTTEPSLTLKKKFLDLVAKEHLVWEPVFDQVHLYSVKNKKKNLVFSVVIEGNGQFLLNGITKIIWDEGSIREKKAAETSSLEFHRALVFLSQLAIKDAYAKEDANADEDPYLSSFRTDLSRPFLYQGSVAKKDLVKAIKPILQGDVSKYMLQVTMGEMVGKATLKSSEPFDGTYSRIKEIPYATITEKGSFFREGQTTNVTGYSCVGKRDAKNLDHNAVLETVGDNSFIIYHANDPKKYFKFSFDLNVEKIGNLITPKNDGLNLSSASDLFDAAAEVKYCDNANCVKSKPGKISDAVTAALNFLDNGKIHNLEVQYADLEGKYKQCTANPNQSGEVAALCARLQHQVQDTLDTRLNEVGARFILLSREYVTARGAADCCAELGCKAAFYNNTHINIQDVPANQSSSGESSAN